jgi:transaldolase
MSCAVARMAVLKSKERTSVSQRHRETEREPNVFIRIPSTKEGSARVAAADAFLRGVRRRIDAGLKSSVGSVASLFVSRWDSAVSGRAPDSLRNQLGIAIAKRTYEAHRMLLDSPRWQRAFNRGARPSRYADDTCMETRWSVVADTIRV